VFCVLGTEDEHGRRSEPKNTCLDARFSALPEHYYQLGLSLEMLLWTSADEPSCGFTPKSGPSWSSTGADLVESCGFPQDSKTKYSQDPITKIFPDQAIEASGTPPNTTPLIFTSVLLSYERI